MFSEGLKPRGEDLHARPGVPQRTPEGGRAENVASLALNPESEGEPRARSGGSRDRRRGPPRLEDHGGWIGRAQMRRRTATEREGRTETRAARRCARPRVPAAATDGAIAEEADTDTIEEAMKCSRSRTKMGEESLEASEVRQKRVDATETSVQIASVVRARACLYLRVTPPSRPPTTPQSASCKREPTNQRDGSIALSLPYFRCVGKDTV